MQLSLFPFMGVHTCRQDEKKILKMSLKQPALVLLTVCVAAAAQCSTILNETQARVDVPVGSTLTLCHRLKRWTPKRFRICWHFNPSGPTLVHSEQLFCSNMSNRTEHKDTLLNYTLSNVTQQHSGWYFCRIHVDIPTLLTMNSSGTPVLIHAPPLDMWWLWVAVGVLGLIILALLVLCVLLIRQRKRKESRCAIYVNTHHSPRPPALGAQLRVDPSSQRARTPSTAKDNHSSSKQRPKQQPR
ncbi:uncharacterized protein LOC133480846 isoform X2 [Phyllopteryx taeniolatus]|uniref:uncharacterized protein LOC133480846 isoform X2 n=1 Tax=Phyllopteryx taeniolatus TaxID=161469 RepID=UPI002AD36D6A|nr:uncharacterized protein LOC133480846 isoform X2 [Phyllopteryx taeniolatus]